MGDGSWIVLLPQPKSVQPGHLFINPTAEDRYGFTNVQLQPQPGGEGTDNFFGWRDGMLSGCLIKDSDKKKLCGKTLMDTGASGFSIDSADTSGREFWEIGTRATFEIEGGSQPITFSFVTGPEWSTHVRVHPMRNPKIGRISAGTQPYFAYAVLYDAKSGSIGFKARAAE